MERVSGTVWARLSWPDGFKLPFNDDIERLRAELYCPKLDKLFKHLTKSSVFMAIYDCCRQDVPSMTQFCTPHKIERQIDALYNNQLININYQSI